MFETTERDLLRWQLRAQRALGVFLEHAYREDLPALTWTVNTLGGLIGDVGSLNCTPAEQRAAFDAWCGYLDGNRWQERTNAAGRTRLQAQFEYRDEAGERVRGVIRADLRPDDEPEAGGRRG